jgi:hypothetical protein
VIIGIFRAKFSEDNFLDELQDELQCTASDDETTPVACDSATALTSSLEGAPQFAVTALEPPVAQIPLEYPEPDYPEPEYTEPFFALEHQDTVEYTGTVDVPESPDAINAAVDNAALVPEPRKIAPKQKNSVNSKKRNSINRTPEEELAEEALLGIQGTLLCATKDNIDGELIYSSSLHDFCINVIFM